VAAGRDAPQAASRIASAISAALIAAGQPTSTSSWSSGTSGQVDELDRRRCVVAAKAGESRAVVAAVRARNDGRVGHQATLRRSAAGDDERSKDNEAFHRAPLGWSTS
jgi:hypothetical protein